MKRNRKNASHWRTIATLAGACAMLALAGCATGGDEAAETADAAPPAEEPAVSSGAATAPFGAPAPRFAVPSGAALSPPSVNTVPTQAPAPSSTEEERERARRGLIADLANARHSEQGGRMQPVVVRPYVETTASETPAQGAAPDAPITNRLDDPAPPRPDGAPAKPAAGPAPANRIPTGS